jgi:nitronate monooxygenase
VIWANELTERLGIEYPIVQAPMFGVTTPQMVAAAAGVGCLGSLPLGDLPPENCAKLIEATGKLTDRPFAINLFLNDVPPIDETLRQRYTRAKVFMEQLGHKHGLEFELPEINALNVTTYHQHIDVLIEHEIKLVSFTFGNFDPDTIRRLKQHGVTLIGTCTSTAEAKLFAESGIDIACLQGLEAGGHRGSFLDGKVPHIGGLSLLSDITRSIGIPIIYAGGIHDARAMLAAKTMGAIGFQIGSVLLASQESGLQDFEKARLQRVTEDDIVLTKSFSGRYARGIRNAFIEAIEHSEHILPYPWQNKLTASLRKSARAASNADFVNIWVGQSIAGGFSTQSTAQILKELISQVEALHAAQNAG